MRSSSVACGIKGVLPYVRQVAPHCLVPVQLADLAHARIAIDATLLTQRFFYRDSADPSRHLDGFRDVIGRLRAAQCVPIFVFDHLHARLPQKARENARRRAAHRLASARHVHEQQRAVRLQELCESMAMFQQFSRDDQARTCALFRQLRHAGRPDPPPALDAVRAERWAQRHMALSEAEHARILALLPTTLSDDMYEPFEHDTYVAVDGPPAAAALPWAVSDHAERDDAPFVWHVELLATPPALARALWTQQVGMHAAQHDGVQETLSQCHATHAEAFIYDTIAQGPDVHGELACDAQSWHTICEALLKSALPPRPLSTSEAWDAHAAAMHLHAFNAHLVDIYRRASRLVPQEAYLECMELCRRLEAPVLVTGDGTSAGGAIHEAEAFASALVHEGYADMVASEDTDVLLYSVPMLRGLSNMALELVDPQAIRAALFPDTPQSQRADSMVQFALLCGTDFNRTIPGIAAKNAHRLVTLFHTRT
ncbi:hypothetical protein MCAP1_001440 [Malassezia caprae]|uniref:XPG N-terminal domain-containing protein n=1 Tax=Malassezia caprae TaxID=1381934 RepID=A0AAF0EAS0_9BASI|nr:hypothetical protein MCAP1_001440 [Malassezia caprae]